MQEIDVSDIGDISSSISHYYSLASMFPQLDSNQSEKLKEFWDTHVLIHAKDKKYMDYNANQYWRNIEFHYIQQMWSNTSCGWEGIGGSAMTTAYTLIIHPTRLPAIFVYYSGKLVYVAYANHKLKKYVEYAFKNLPGYQTAQKELDIIYVNRNRY